MKDESTYGFNKEDAEALIEKIGLRDEITPGRRIPVRARATGGITLWRFTLNEAWSSGAADADILEMDGTDTGTDADVLDPLGIFSTLGNGDAGLCILQGGSYYVIQAPCPA